MKTIAKGILIDTNIHAGKPIIEGTRVTVDLVMRELGEGMAMEEVMREYDLTEEQVRNVLRYAASRLEEEETIAI